MRQTLAEIALHAADLVEEGWCQGAMALNVKGQACRIDDEEATRFCLDGAIHRSTLDLVGPGGWPIALRDELLKHPAIRGHASPRISKYNDWPGRTAEEVATVLRDTAKALNGEGPTKGPSPAGSTGPLGGRR